VRSSLPLVAVLGAAVLFGTSGTAQELGPDGSTPLGVAAIRIAIGSAVLWAAVAVQRVRGVAAMVRANGRGVLVGAAGVATYTPLFLAAADRGGVAAATIVTISSGPFFAGGLEWATRGRRPTVAWLVGTIVSVAGAVLLVSSTSTTGKTVDAPTVAMALAAGLGYGVYSVAAKATMDRGMHSTVALAAPFTLAAAVLLVLATGQPFGWLGEASGVAMAAHLGVLATGVAYVLFGYGLDHLSSATTVTLVLAEPVTAAILATTVLDESIEPLGWVGIGVVLCGLVVVGRAATPER
jgi:DME family drug/metabolite transporter